jgi:hypothetical protein
VYVSVSGGTCCPGATRANAFLATGTGAVAVATGDCCRSAFDKLDTRRTGHITVADLQMVVGADMTGESLCCW